MDECDYESNKWISSNLIKIQSIRALTLSSKVVANFNLTNLTLSLVHQILHSALRHLKTSLKSKSKHSVLGNRLKALFGSELIGNMWSMRLTHFYILLTVLCSLSMQRS